MENEFVKPLGIILQLNVAGAGEMAATLMYASVLRTSHGFNQSN